jgi:hypothetical protein
MQIEVSKTNEVLMAEYVAKAKGKFPGYNPSATSLINAAATFWLIKENKKFKKSK